MPITSKYSKPENSVGTESYFCLNCGDIPSRATHRSLIPARLGRSKK